MNKIKIKEVAIFHPQNSVDNQFYLDHFDKKGKDIRGLLNVMGREKRYINNEPNETSLTMAIKATNVVLEKTNLKAIDLDMIIFTSQTPETTFHQMLFVYLTILNQVQEQSCMI